MKPFLIDDIPSIVGLLALQLLSMKGGGRGRVVLAWALAVVVGHCPCLLITVQRHSGKAMILDDKNNNNNIINGEPNLFSVYLIVCLSIVSLDLFFFSSDHLPCHLPGLPGWYLLLNNSMT
jgi:hypothetical protein